MFKTAKVIRHLLLSLPSLLLVFALGAPVDSLAKAIKVKNKSKKAIVLSDLSVAYKNAQGVLTWQVILEAGNSSDDTILAKGQESYLYNTDMHGAALQNWHVLEASVVTKAVPYTEAIVKKRVVCVAKSISGVIATATLFDASGQPPITAEMSDLSYLPEDSAYDVTGGISGPISDVYFSTSMPEIDSLCTLSGETPYSGTVTVFAHLDILTPVLTPTATEWGRLALVLLLVGLALTVVCLRRRKLARLLR